MDIIGDIKVFNTTNNLAEVETSVPGGVVFG
jgi:hypothetical protein